MIRFEIHVRPGARVERVGGTHAGALLVQVRERAIEGEANEAVTRALAQAFDVSRNDVTLLRGHRSRRKFFSVSGDDTLLNAVHEQLRESH